MDGRRVGLLCACLTATLWGILTILLRTALRYLDASAIVAWRFLFASVTLGLLFLAFRPKALWETVRRPPWRAVVAGLLLGLNYFAVMRGVALTSASNTNLLIQIAPMMLVVSGVVFFGERFVRIQFIGLALAALGLFLFYRAQVKEVFGASADYWHGNAWIFLGAVSWVAYAILHKVTVRSVGPQRINLVVYTSAALVFLPALDLPAMAVLSLPALGLMIVLGANTLIAYGALAVALQRIPASHVSLVVVMNPMITLAVLAAAGDSLSFVAAEPVSTSTLMGAVLLLGGAALVIAHPLFTRTRPAQSQSVSTS